MKKNITNARGFTLVELLAVIVVLAIVILLALQAVMPALSSAKKQVFALEANGAIEAAQTYFMNNNLTGSGQSLPVNDGGARCVPIQTLIDGGFSDLDPESYSGRVLVKKSGNIYVYNVSIQKDKTLMVTSKGYSSDTKYNEDVTGDDVVDYNETTFGSYTSCPDDPAASTNWPAT